MTDDEYYSIRNTGLRSGIDGRLLDVHLHIPRSFASSATTQLMALNFLNIVLRFVPTVTVYLPAEPMGVLIRHPFSGSSIDETVRNLFEVCDPRGNFRIQREGQESARGSAVLSIGVGPDAISGCDLYLSADGYIGASSTTPPKGQRDGVVPVGACIAALLGAANIARFAANLEPLTLRLSGWNFREGGDAAQGPSDWSPIDVGVVRLIGAGAVGSALVYWLYQWGVLGNWQIVDADTIKLKNIGKSLLYRTSEAEEFAPSPVSKAGAIAQWLPHATVFAKWHDDSSVSAANEPDLIIPVANEQGIRPAVASESRTVVLHATTNTDWDSMLHRHIAGIDDCIACRIPEMGVPKFQCSTGRVGEAKEGNYSFDASLPFVAGASGLMLAALLNRLQRGELLSLAENCWRWHWMAARKLYGWSSYKCDPGCVNYLPASTRLAANSHSLWASLDPANEGK